MDKLAITTNLVIGAYRGVIRNEHDTFTYVRVKSGSKSEKSASMYWDAAREIGVPLTDAMGKSLSFYGKTWCLNTFNRPFPPFPVVIGEKSRCRLIREFPKKEKSVPEHLMEEAKSVARFLVESIGRPSAIKIVRDGWPEDEKLRKLVIKEVASGTGSD